MSSLFNKGVIVDDEWSFVDGEAPVPEGENVIVSLQLFKQNRLTLLTGNAGKLGVHLEADDQIGEITDHLDQFALVSLEFPSFADGRAFSKARLLRDRHGFSGQIRATGDIRIDQVSHMHRSGFDALLITHQPTIDALIEIKEPGLHLFYQPAFNDAPSHHEKVIGKSWTRRSMQRTL